MGKLLYLLGDGFNMKHIYRTYALITNFRWFGIATMGPNDRIYVISRQSC